jgi:hypothetical protein
LRRMTIFLSLLLCLICASPSLAQTLPTVKAKALDDSEVTLPNPASQQILILIVGFSKKSGDICQPWTKRISKEMMEDPRVDYYQIAQLEAAPKLMRPVILHGMRGALNPQEQSHFIPLYDRVDDWKKLVNFTAPDDAYLIVADPSGRVIWQAHGIFSEAIYAELKKTINDLFQKPASSPK